MKSYKFFLGILGVALIGSMSVSCVSDKEFLTEKPKGQLTVNNAYNSSSQVVNTLLTGYYEYEELFFPGEFGQGICYNTSAGTDMTDNKYQLGASQHMSNFSAAWSSTTGLPKSLWDKFYKIISYANLANSQMDNVTWDNEAQKTRTVGEAAFLRGISYLRLGELFGAVPLVLEYSETPNYAFNRDPRKDVYDTAINDLKTAYTNLPESVEYGRAGKSVAAMYLAEALLAQGVETNNNALFTEAAKYAQEVVSKHPLMTERFGVRAPGATGSRNGIANEYLEGNVYSDLFVADNIISSQNTEALWIMVCAPNYAEWSTNGGRRNNTLGLTPALQDYEWAPEYKTAGAADGPWKSFSAKYGGALSPASHGGTGWAQTTPTWYASYTMWDAEHNNNSTQDLRYQEDVTVQTEFLCCDDKHPLYEQKVGWNHINRSTPELSGIFFPIYYKETPFSEWDYDMTSKPMFGWMGTFVNFYRSRYAARSAEAYFLLAEAKLRSGDAAGAAEALNVVRSRAKANPIANVTIDTILDERARELVYEEFRWATFLRMKPEEWKPRIYNYGMYSARPGAEVYPNIRRWSEDPSDLKFNLLPIPQTYIDLNTGSDGMTQNEGWE